MKNIYKADLNGAEVFLVGEENNTISHVFQSIDHARKFKETNEGMATAIAVNEEVLSFGKHIGWVKNKELVV